MTIPSQQNHILIINLKRVLSRFKKLKESFAFSAAFLFHLSSTTLFSAEWIHQTYPANWSDNANWTAPATYPNGPDDFADFRNSSVGTDPNIILTENITVARVDISYTSSYIFDPGTGFSLNFEVGAGSSTVNVLTTTGTSAHTFNCPVVLVNDTIFTTDRNLTITGDVSGTGMLTKNGSGGDLILSGTNDSFSGDIEIVAGSLQVSSDSNLGTGNLIFNGGTLNTTATFSSSKTVTLTDTGTIDPDNATTLTLSGVISGASSLTKTGTGTLVLSGSNDYSGGTAISAGTLSLSGAGALYSTGEITVNSGTFDITAISPNSMSIGILTGDSASFVNLGQKILTINESAPTTFAGVIEGTNGFLVKTGTSTLTLSGINTYTGGTTIDNGTLALSGSGALDSTGSITINNSAILDISAVTTSATIGSLAGSAGSSIITTGKSLIVNESAGTTFAGVIQGGGSLTKTGAATLTLSGINTYDGGTTIDAGTLALSGSGALDPAEAVTINNSAIFDISAVTTSATIGPLTGSSGASVVTTDKSLIINESVGTTFAGTLSGAGGSFTKAGSAALNFTGTLTQESVTVSAGTLLVNTDNFTTTDLTVNSGATLGGLGTVTGDVTNNGTISPGNSIDTINIAGNYLQASGSQYIVEVNPSDSDLIIVTGATTIESNTTLNVQLSYGNYAPNRQYLILTSAGGLTGAYQFEIASPPLFSFSTSYTANDVYLFLNVMPLNFMGLDQEAEIVAEVLNNANPPEGSDLETLIDFLYFMSIPELESTLHAMSPAQLSDLDLTTQEIFVDVGNILSFQMNQFCKKSSRFKARGWAKYFGAYYNQSTVGTVPGYEIHPQGGLAGFDFSNDTGAFLGFSGGYSEGRLVWENARGTAKVENGFGSIYGGKTFESSLYLQGSVTGAAHWYDTKRNILFSSDEFTPFTRTAVGETSGSLAQGEFEVGSYFDKFIKCRPFLKTGYTFLHRDSFNESGAGEINLRVEQENSDLLRSEAGLELAYTRSSPRKSITPSLLVGGIYEAHFLGKQQRASFQAPSNTMVVDGIGENRWIFEIEGAFTMSLFENRFNLGGNVHYELGDDYSQLSCLGEFRFAF